MLYKWISPPNFALGPMEMIVEASKHYSTGRILLKVVSATADANDNYWRVGQIHTFDIIELKKNWIPIQDPNDILKDMLV